MRLAWQHVGALTLSVWSFGLCFVFLGPLKLCNKLGTSSNINEDFGMRETETALPGKLEYYMFLLSTYTTEPKILKFRYFWFGPVQLVGSRNTELKLLEQIRSLF